MKYCGKQAQLVKLCQCRMLEIERITTRFHSCFSKQPVGAYLLCRSRCARRGKIATYRVCRVASPRVPSSLDRPSIRVYYFLSEKSFTEEKPIHLSIPLWNFVRDKPPTISPTISVCRVNGKSNGCSRFCKSQVSGEETLNKDAKIVLVYDIHFAQTFKPSSEDSS